MTIKIHGCCPAPDIQETDDIVCRGNWKFPYLLTACNNCGKIRSRSSFYDAKERIDEYAFSGPTYDDDKYKET
jgi:hypothetical protein